MKNMKFKALAVAVMALGASSAFATTALTPATYASGSADESAYVNTNIPQATLYIAGSSALGGAVKPVVLADIFDTSTQPVVLVNDMSASPTQTVWKADGSAAGGQPVTAWLGLGKSTLPTPYAGKLIYVVYNNWNGSAAGLSQVLVASTAKAYIPEADVVLPGPVSSKGVPATTLTGAVANTCTPHTASVSGFTTLSSSSAPIVDCTTHGVLQADLAISDVNLDEVFALETPSAGTAPSSKAIDKVLTEIPKGIVTVPLAVQGFAVAVNANLYAALQAQNIADGLLPSSCAPSALLSTSPNAANTGTNSDAIATGVQTSAQFACMPSIRRADYSTLVTGADLTRNAADIILGPNSSGDTTAVELARRDDFSGTQATSNMFFADNACGATTVGGKAVVGVLGGAQNVLNSLSLSAAKPAGLTVDSNAVTGLVVNALNGTSGYAVGVVTLNKTQGGSDTWKFVKMNGVSPIHSAAGVYDAKQRVAQASGLWSMASTSYAAYPSKLLATKNPYGTATGIDGVSTDKNYTAANSLLPTIVTGLTSSSLHNLTGIGYTDGAVSAQQTAYQHAKNPGTPVAGSTAGQPNNCAPMVHL
jgi:hypothetical protein